MNCKLSDILKSDLKRYGFEAERDIPFITKREMYGYRFTKSLRKCKYYKANRNRFLYLFNRIRLAKMSVKYGFQISYATEIGRGFYIGHMGNVVINSAAKIGKNVNISQGVTIGISNGGVHSGVPKIGNNVWIGANSVIVGGITVGDDVIIAPNTFVNFDVPSHSVVIGSKAEIHSKENATEHYIKNTVE